MSEILIPALMVVAAMLAALGLVVGAAEVGRIWRRTQTHPMVYLIVVMLVSAALAVLLSGRNFSSMADDVIDTAAPTNAVVVWITRLSSLFIVFAALERIYQQQLRRAGATKPPLFMLLTFVVYWVCAIALPSVLSTHPIFLHDYTYTLFLGIGVCLVTPQDSQRSVTLARNSFVVFMLASLALIPIRPDLVLDFNYSQGILGTFPRFAGLSSHANVLGPFCVLGLLFVWVQPFDKPWINRLAWAVLLVCLVWSQSKTSWTSFTLCTVWLLAYRHARPAARWLANERNHLGTALLLGTCMAVIFLLAAALWVADFSTVVDAFLASRVGNQVSTMTGRDLIWATAIKEWHASPIFGYGPTLFDEVHRAAIGMDFATHGHNQVLDTLARSGTVGAFGLGLFAITLFSRAILAVRRTGGLSVALMIVLVFLAIGEVPFNIVNYGPENLCVWLLMLVLCGYQTKTSVVAAPAGP
ncbi:MAG TPA: O-antigen ligase family protein, partial [Burkholderiaceae bacterium]